MRTRTLLLLAIGCGLAILLAGGIQLLRLAGQSKPPAPLTIGQQGVAGDARVTVTGYDERGGAATVSVRLGGVSDPAGLKGFALVTPGKAVTPDSSRTTCKGLTKEEVSCTIVFGVAGAKGTDRMLLFQRAAETVRWKLV
jgi:hypothetical protein